MRFHVSNLCEKWCFVFLTCLFMIFEGMTIPWWRFLPWMGWFKIDTVLTRSLGRGGNIWTESLMNTRQARITTWHRGSSMVHIIYFFSGWQETSIWQRISDLESWYSRITGYKKKLPISNGQSPTGPTYFATGENSWGTTLMLPTYLITT